MPIEDEAQAIHDVVERVESKFPQVPAEVVQEQVDATLSEFDGSTVRDFVPVLVEHKVTDELRHHDEH
jgi:CRISPR/Cas system-associated exonuclease Cas4 (RecB family)